MYRQGDRATGVRYSRILTVKCWNNHALMIFVATFGNIPRFFCLLVFLSSPSSSAVPSPDPTLLSSPSPVKENR